MGWSTSELARLAGTTVNTVRHYHRLGLLDEPLRRYNGYKQYEVGHLVRLLRIRRMVDLGIPLGHISTVAEAPGDAAAALREIDAQLEAGIERLQKTRADIAAILREGAPADGPAGFEHVAARLTQSDSSAIHLLAQVFDDEKLTDIRRMVEADTGSTSTEIDRLPDDADEQTRQRLAERMVPGMVRDFRDYPWLLEPFTSKSTGDRRNLQILTDSMPGLYSPAQLDVLLRAVLAAAEEVRGHVEDGADGGG
jgi:DNA-binding transcriptional MerR regulator